MPRRRIASSTSGTTRSGPASANSAARSSATTAAAAPLASASRTKSWPSRTSPLMAKNRSPGSSVRVSIETPVAPRQAPDEPGAGRGGDLVVASRGARSSANAPRSPPGRPRGPKTARSGRRRSGRFHGLCRRRRGRRRCAAPGPRRGSPRRGRRSRARPAPPARISARIAAGSSLRGLSSVTITMSAFSTAIRAHDRPLALVAVAAAAEDADEAARGEGAQRVEDMRERVGLVGVVDERDGAVDLADRLEPAGHALQPREGRRGPRRRRPRLDREDEPRGEERVLDLEGADQRQIGLDLLAQAAFRQMEAEREASASRPRRAPRGASGCRRRVRWSSTRKPRSAAASRKGSAMAPSALTTAGAPGGGGPRTGAASPGGRRRSCRDSRGGRGRDW